MTASGGKAMMAILICVHKGNCAFLPFEVNVPEFGSWMEEFNSTPGTEESFSSPPEWLGWSWVAGGEAMGA